MIQSLIRIFLICFFSLLALSIGAQFDIQSKDINRNAYPEKAIVVLEKARATKPKSNEILNILLEEASALESVNLYPQILAQIYHEIFDSYRKLRKHQLGTPYLTKVAELIHEYGTEEEEWVKIKADFFASRAFTFYWEYQTDEAIIEMEKALKFYKHLKDDFKTGVSLNGLGVYHSEKNDSEKAIKFFDEAFDYFESSENEPWKLRSQFCKAVDLIHLERLDESRGLLLEILPILERTNHVNYRFAISKLGEIEMKLKNFDEAEKLMKQSIDWSLENNNHNSIVTTGDKLISLYEQQKYYDKALEFSKLKSAHQDSLLTQFNETKNIKAQEQLEVFEQKQIVKELEYQQKIERNKFRNRLFYLVGFFSFLLTILIFWIYSQRSKRKQTLLLQSKEDEIQKVRENLLSSVTHELRTPLTLIVGQIEQLQNGDLSKSDQKITKKLDRNASDLLAQIDQLLHWKRTEAKAMVLSPALGDAAAIMKEVFLSTRSNFETKNLQWSYDIFPEKLTLELDFGKLKVIVKNLLSNAAKYTPEGGTVILKMALESEDRLKISVEDNGIGISETVKDKIFNWYQRAQETDLNNSSGFGVGLALSNELSKLMKGELNFTSTEGVGSVFSLILPIEKISEVQSFEARKIERLEPNSFKENIKETSCLIIEDHPELLVYLKDLLSEMYDVFTADSAEKGIELALKHLPDIIISDQMLPGKTGLELCKDLKEHILTDHIPIIILTALNNEEIHHLALKNRADSFITKPFKQKELSLTINNLIQNRRRLKIRYQRNDPVMKLKKDDPFINLMVSNIELNYTDSKYNVDALANNLKISRTQLFKKSKALIDSSPSALIKKHRLDQAKKSLENGDKSVSETAYSCGFSSPEYFSTVFKEHFKQSPKEFLKK